MRCCEHTATLTLTRPLADSFACPAARDSLVTNDHVATLTKMADSTITVSAIDRSKVRR